MTNEEASVIIGNIPIIGDGCYSIPEYQQAKAMAIQSLEAWDKVREIFKAKSTSKDWEYIHDLQIWEDALDIIDKHLSEVSE